MAPLDLEGTGGGGGFACRASRSSLLVDTEVYLSLVLPIFSAVVFFAEMARLFNSSTVFVVLVPKPKTASKRAYV
jgi:hypothetical protein